MYATNPIYQNAPGAMRLYKSALPVWVIWLFVFTVFSREIGYTSIAGIDYDLIAYNFFILYLLAQLRNFYLNTKLVVTLGLLILAGIGAKIYLNLDFQPFWKQFIPILHRDRFLYGGFRAFPGACESALRMEADDGL